MALFPNFLASRRMTFFVRKADLARRAEDPTVWTGRVLQAGFERWRGLVLRFCIRPVNRAFMLLAIMDIRTHPISFCAKGPERPVGSPDHGCDGETVSPSPQSNSQTSAVS